MPFFPTLWRVLAGTGGRTPSAGGSLHSRRPTRRLHCRFVDSRIPHGEPQCAEGDIAQGHLVFGEAPLGHALPGPGALQEVKGARWPGSRNRELKSPDTTVVVR